MIDRSLPYVISVFVQSGLSVDVTYNEIMGSSAEVSNNYIISGTGKGTLSENPENVVYVGGNTYRLTWSSGDMVDGGDITIQSEVGKGTQFTVLLMLDSSAASCDDVSADVVSPRRSL